MITLIAIATLIFTFTVTLFSLGSVARDTAQAIQSFAVNSRNNGRLMQSLCFAGLWLMIFVLSFG